MRKDAAADARAVNKEAIRRELRQKAIRLKLMAAAFFVMSALLVARLAYVQIAKGDYYSAKAVNQQGPGTVVEPMRGSIYDRNGEELAVSIPMSFVFISPNEIRKSVEARNEYVTEQLERRAKDSESGGIADWIASLAANFAPSGADTAEESSSKSSKTQDQSQSNNRELRHTSLDIVAEGLAEALGLDAADLRGRLDKDSLYDELVRRADNDAAARARDFLRGEGVYGLYVRDSAKRSYRGGSLAAHVIGFVGDDNQGLSGVEVMLDSDLAGSPGKGVESDDGAEDGKLAEGVGGGIPAKDGLNAVLTLDATIQGLAETALRRAINDADVRNGGAIIIMDPRNGDVLALVSLPDFDLNAPFAAPQGYDSETWNGRTKADADILNSTVWRNKAIMDTYEPGSTFKAFTAAAALEEASISTNSTFTCAPVYVKGWDEPLKCSSTVGHGVQDLAHAVYNSCNPAFMSMSRSLGVDVFYQYARDFGFMEKTGVGLTGEAAGNFHAEPKLIDMLVASFGQRFTITPIGLATGYCAIANGGSLVRPRLVKALTDSDGNVVESFEPQIVRKVISKETAATMRDILEGVVRDGTGRNAYVSGYRVAGKTGTSETVDEGRFIASFAAIAPADDPVVCALVMLDNPQGDSHMGGAVAAPVMRGLLEDTLTYLGVEREYSESDQKALTTLYAVPDLTEMTVDEATRALKNSGLKHRLQAGIEDMSTKVSWQYPEAGVMVSSGSIVAVYASDQAEPSSTTVPDIIGMTVSRAKETLAQAGLNIEIEGAGQVSAQTPEAGEVADVGTLVNASFRYMNNIE